MSTLRKAAHLTDTLAIVAELEVWTDPLTLAEHLAGGATMESLKRIHPGYAFLKSYQRLEVPMRPSLPRVLGGVAQ